MTSPSDDFDRAAAVRQARRLGPQGVIGIVFTLVGVPLLVAGAVWASLVAPTYLSSASTRGTVVDSVAYGTGGDRSHRITVAYTVDGRDYRYTPTGSQDPAPSVGDTVTVHYEPDDPGKARLGGAAGVVEWVGPGVLLLLGLVFGGLGIGFSVWKWHRRKRDLAIVDTGDRLAAAVESMHTERVSDSEGGSKTVWSLVVRHDDPLTGATYRFTHRYSGVPGVTPPPGTPVTVFADRVDRGKYVIAIW
ncbi:DUF3592 domain-containing protein [Gordonia malaquae]|uniref:DUF3592 domain-containing protein n=1 Tax=Gordonia malaquae TaxID=410332 RepID=UPI0030FF238B